MSNWFVLQVLSGQEKKVKKTLEEQAKLMNVDEFIHEVMLPTENVQEVKQGETKVVEKKLWPGYLLIRMDMDDRAWDFVRRTNGIVGFLGGATPTSLTNDEVNGILNDLKEKKGRVTQRHQFQVGDTVKIVDGVFVNFVGTIIEVSAEKGRLSAMVSIFGRDTRVDDLDFTQVEQVSEETEV